MDFVFLPVLTCITFYSANSRGFPYREQALTKQFINKIENMIGFGKRFV